jgi:hypothetical protein
MTAGAPVVIRLLQTSDCPHVSRVHALLDAYLRESGTSAVVEDVIGDYPSPTLVIDGVDVVTRRPPTGDVACCRLDLPTRTQIADALGGQHGQ